MRTRMMKRLMAFSLAGVMLLSLLASVTLLSDAYSTDEYVTMSITAYDEEEYGYRTGYYPYGRGYDYYRSRYYPYGGYDYYESEYDYHGFEYVPYGFDDGYNEDEYDYYGYSYYGYSYDYEDPGNYPYESGYYYEEAEYESNEYGYGYYGEAYQEEYETRNYYSYYDRYDSKYKYDAEADEYLELVYEKLGIKPFVTMPPYVAVMFRDYASSGVMVAQFHTPTRGTIPYLGVYIGGIRPEHWELHRWAIIYSISETVAEEHRIYEFWYDTFPADYVLMHRLPDTVCLERGWWHMLPTFRVYLIPIPPVLSGTVTCEDTGRPIPDVRINLYDGDGALISYRITDGNGFFDFGEVPIGNLEVVMDYRTIPPGYRTDMSRVRRPLATAPGGVYEEHYLVYPLVPPTLTKTVSHVNGEVYDGEAVDVGDVVTYVLTVNNPNPRILRNFLVRDILPEGLALNVDSVTVSPATALVDNTSAANTVEVVLDLPAGNTTITFTAVVTLAAYEYIENVAILYGPPDNGGTRPEVDRDPEVIPVVETEPPTLTKAIAYVNGEEHAGEAVYAGDVITYVLTVNNPNRRPLNNFLVRDLLPGEVRLDVESVIVHLASSLAYNNTANNMIEVILNLPSGDTTITFNVVVTEEASEIILNTAILYGPPEDGARKEVDRDNEQVPVAEFVDPTLVKTATHVNGVVYTGTPVDVGDRVTYVLTITNPNRRTLHDFLVRDELPDGLALLVESVIVNPKSALVYDLSAYNTVEVILNLPPGDITIAFTAEVTMEAYEEIINVATLYGPPVDGDRNEVDDDTERVPVVEMNDPTITKTATYVNGEAYDGAVVDVGDVITYVLTVNNPNRRILRDFLVRDMLPGSLALNVDSVVVNPADALVYNLSAYNTVEVILNLSPGDTTITFTTVVTEEAYREIINVATIYSPPGDDGNREEVDDDTEQVPVEEVNDPTLVKTATYVNGEAYTGAVVDVGDVITYVLTVNNPNRRALNNFLVRDVLPGSLALEVDSVVVSPESALVYNLSAYNTVEVILNLFSGATTITFTAIVTEEAYEQIINIARIYGPPGDDGNREEVDNDDERVPVEEVIDPTIVKSATYLNGEAYDGEPVDVGDVVTYVLTVNNPNRRNLNNFLVRDALPVGLTLQVDSIVVYPENALVYNHSADNIVEVVLNLSSGITTITFEAMVTAYAYEEIINVATIYSPPGDDGNREEIDDDTERVPVVEVIDPTIEKAITYVNDEAHTGEAVDVGDVITYVLTVNNPNRRALNDFLVRDVLPEGLALQVNSVVVYPVDALVYNRSAGNTVEVILNLPAGDTNITFSAVVTEEAYEIVENVATIYGPPGEDGNRDEVDYDTEEVPVVESELPTITKALTHVNDNAHTGAAVIVGDAVTYVLTVNNPNRRTLNDFLVRDVLPNGLALQLDRIVVQPAGALVNNNSNGNTVEVVLNLPSGETTITFTAVVTAAAEAYEEIINVAIIYGPPEDDGTREEVDRDDEAVEVILLSPTLTKTASYVGERVQVGDVITYALTVNNPNATVLENFVVIDALPVGLALNVASVNVSPADALVVNTTEGNTVRAVLNLPAGNTIITFTAVVTDAAQERIRNVARLYSPDGPVDEDDYTVNLLPGGGGDEPKQPPTPPTPPRPPAGPQTGDTANLILWILLTSFGFVGFVAIAAGKRTVKVYNKRVDSLIEEMVHYIKDK